MKKIVGLITVIFTVISASAQDALPGFTITERNQRVVISWTNSYPNVMQLNIQRSYDSLKYFATIFSPEAPGLSQNGYTDNVVPSGKVFYRIFFVLSGGDYYFTKSKRAGVYNPAISQDITSYRDVNSTKLTNIDPADRRIVSIKIKNALYKQLPAYLFKNFRDSILKQTKDTLFAINDSLITVSPYVAKDVWRSSRYIFVNTDGYINISLPKAEERKYQVKFFEENGAPLFDIAHVRESPLILDKATFIHAGWFNFELYEDDKLKEKNKFYLPKDF